MNKFQNTVRQLAKKRSEEEFDAFTKENGEFEDFVEIVETEEPGKPWVRVEFIHKDEEGYNKWSEAFDKLRSHKEIMREVKAELRKGPRL